MSLYFVKFSLGTKTYKSQVSISNCTFVDDFKTAIKDKWANVLNNYDIGQITLYQPDGKTELDPETSIIDPATNVCVFEGTPMIVVVDPLLVQTVTGSVSKQQTYKGMSTEASCRKYLDALALEIYLEYNFRKAYKRPTMGDVLAAKSGQFGKPEYSVKKDQTGKQTKEAVRISWWDYQINDDGVTFTSKPLPDILSIKQWDFLSTLNYDTIDRIHDAQLLRTCKQQPFVVLPHSKFTASNYVDTLQEIAAIIGVVKEKKNMVVKNESDLSSSWAQVLNLVH